MKNKSMTDLAKIAYTKFAQAIGGLHDIRWEELDEPHQEAWRQAVEKVLESQNDGC